MLIVIIILIVLFSSAIFIKKKKKVTAITNSSIYKTEEEAEEIMLRDPNYRFIPELRKEKGLDSKLTFSLAGKFSDSVKTFFSSEAHLYMMVTLEHDLNNPVDSNAVQVKIGRKRPGYVPSRSAEKIKNIIADGNYISYIKNISWDEGYVTVIIMLEYKSPIT